MLITKEWLNEKEACTGGLNWFTANYPDGADHKDVYLALESVDKDWGYWLLGSIGGAEFAIRVAMTVCKDEPWTLWANRWLDGTDRSESAARSARSAVWSAWSAESASRSAGSAARSARSASRSYSSLLDILDQCVEDKP